MDDLLKEAIADAKAVRETALQNAKMALEEAFTPKLKSMLAQKIQQEIEDEEMDDEMHHEIEDEIEDEGSYDSEGEHGDEEEPKEEGAHEDEEEAAEEGYDSEEEDKVDEVEDEEDSVDEVEDEGDEEKVDEIEDEEEKVDEVEDEDDDMDEELDLESILAELEAEVNEVEDEEDSMDEEEDKEEMDENDVSSEIGKADNKVADKANDSSETGAQGPEGEGKDEPAGKELDDHEVVKEGEDKEDDMDEDIDLEEVLKALTEEDDDEDETKDEIAKLQGEIKEHRDVVKYLREKLNEVILLNAKLLFSNKLFRAFGLSNEQKLKVVETFDRTKNLREIKLVYSTLAESFKGTKVKPVNESKGSSSKPVASTKPANEEVISEGAELKNRFKKLANIL